MRVKVLRRPVESDEAPGTLLAFGPYPSADLTRIVEGTILIVCRS
jgi:hypothetical protein